MRNLIKLIINNKFFFLFFILQVFSLFLYFSFNPFPRASFLNSSSAISGSIYDVQNGVDDYFNLKTQNEQLLKENALLKEQMMSSFIKLSENFSVINDTLLKQKYHYLQAQVINITLNKRVNFITVNVGSKDGVELNMGVVSDKGIVGVVHNVSNNFSTIRTLLDKSKYNFSPYVTLEKSKYNGPVSWKGINDVYHVGIEDIAQHVKVEKGEKVFSRSETGLFPAGLLVGEVDSVYDEPGNNFHEIYVKLATDFKSLSYVYIIKNVLKDEQLKLEEEFIQTTKK